MYWLRSKKLVRIVVAFVTATLLPMLVVPMPRASSHAVSDDYGEWLRGQVRAPVDEAFEDALASATAEEPGTLTEFLHAFVEAYESTDPDASLADVLAVPDMSSEAVLTHLQKRLVGARGLPMLSPGVGLAAVHHALPLVDGPLSSASVPAVQASFDLVPTAYVVQVSARLVTPLHVLFAAQPRGP